MPFRNNTLKPGIHSSDFECYGLSIFNLLPKSNSKVIPKN